MEDKIINSATGRKVELIIRKIGSLSAMPGTLAQLIPLLKDTTGSITKITEIIKVDPALTANILSLYNQDNSRDPAFSCDIENAIKGISQKQLSHVIMQTKMFQLLPGSPVSQMQQRKELIKFSIAAAIASSKVGQILTGQSDNPIAYTAALLSSVGKFAIEQALPKSHVKICEQTRLLGTSDLEIEKKYLGIDHTILGRRMADNWRLSKEVADSIWLCRSDVEAITTAVGSNHPAVSVALGHLIARDAQIGDPGTYEHFTKPKTFAQNFEITDQQIDEIITQLPEQVNNCISILDLDAEQPEQVYSQAIWELATNLANDNSALTQQNIELKTNTGISEFANKFIPSVASNSTPIEIIEKFSALWQNYYQTGPVCMYLCPDNGEDLIDAVVADKKGQIHIELLSLASDVSLIPEEINAKFNIIDADIDTFGWLYDQIDNIINPQTAKAIPIISSGKTLAVVIWQNNETLSEKLGLASVEGPANIAGPVLELAFSYQSQQRVSEQFASLLGRLGNIKEKLSKTENLEGLAEMAAGAAHELNNPITVVSGRLQMLLNGENDPEKQKTLNLIKERIEDISKIVSDLMQFARPQEPSLRTISPAVLVDSAIDDVRQKYNIADIETNIENLDSLRDIFVDAEQLRQSLANIICNAYQSYHNTGKTVKIIGAEQNKQCVRLQIVDFGIGMDNETLQKATQPFFSGQQAGRRMGMGLAHAQRVLNINNASMHLASQPGKGTTVTLLLPCKND